MAAGSNDDSALRARILRAMWGHPADMSGECQLEELIIRADPSVAFKRVQQVFELLNSLDAPDPQIRLLKVSEGPTVHSGEAINAQVWARELVPGVEYTLRPRNEVEGYRWLTTDSLRVARAD